MDIIGRNLKLLKSKAFGLILKRNISCFTSKER